MGEEKQKHYLYGAAVQGIQGFIFQTNKLAEIVGASELVEEICTSLFDKVLQECGIDKVDGNAVVNAAGNIKYIFDREEDCKKVVRIFPKTVMEHAPGITISQAVVEYPKYYEKENVNNFGEAVQLLESRLRIQRNRPLRDTTIGLMGIERSRQTGLPVTHIMKGEHLDYGTFLKLYEKDGKKERKDTTQKLCRKAFINPQDLNNKEVKAEQISFDIKDMTEKNDWIAIIHADGNGLGQVVQKIGKDQKTFKEFSRKLDKATTQAAVQAFEKIVKPKDLEEMIPMRPIVLSGDDHTVICRADLAIRYIKAFIEDFETNTGKELGGILETYKVFKNGKNYLTACAGIAFIKSSYPFYYGYQLAEALCGRAKKDTKKLYDAEKDNLPASCIMFHKVQDSFVSSYDDIVKRELTPQEGISFEFGPYYINVEGQDRWTVKDLTTKASELTGKEGNAVKSHLRNWMSLLHDNPEMAKQKLARLKAMTPMKDYVECITDDKEGNPQYTRTVKKENKDRDIIVYPVYDILTVHTINNQKTK